MQRKNSILNALYIQRSKRALRSGIAMIMAIAAIVIIATIMALSLALTSQTTKKTTDLYLYEQAILLSKSATEYALLRISQVVPCNPNNLNFVQGIYDINISILYVYSTACGTNNYFTITTPESSGIVLMDVTVGVNNATVTSEPIRYFKRTIQKL